MERTIPPSLHAQICCLLQLNPQTTDTIIIKCHKGKHAELVTEQFLLEESHEILKMLTYYEIIEVKNGTPNK